MYPLVEEARLTTHILRTRERLSSAILAGIFTLIGILRICETYPVFSQTYDEPAHVAAGMEWLTTGRYTYEVQHPPLARIASALGPYLAGVRSQGLDSLWDEGNAILHSQSAYFRNLTLARIGILPFFILAAAMVWLYADHLFGPRVAALSSLLFTNMPVVLGHSAVATTDIPVTAALITAAYASVLLFETPGTKKSIFLGAAVGAAVLCKFSTFVFAPLIIGSAALLVLHRGDRRKNFSRMWGSCLAIAALTCAFTIWAGYRFSLDPVRPPGRTDLRIEDSPKIRPALKPIVATLLNTPVPGSELIRGMGAVAIHNAEGHVSFLLGEVRTHGWWFFYPVVLLVKTPLAALCLVIAGVVWGAYAGSRTTDSLRWMPALSAGLILLVTLPVSINIGVRHILPMYAFLAVLAAMGADAMLRATSPALLRAIAAVLLVWFLASSVASHPDYLAYFNETAQDEPGRILAESDLDWGQDLHRLELALKNRGITEVHLAYAGSASLGRHNLPSIQPLEPYTPASGWIAISEYHFRITSQQLKAGHAEGAFDWLKHYDPIEQVGKSIRLYFIGDTPNTQ